MTPPTPTTLEEAQSIINTQCATIDQMSQDMVKLQGQVAWLARQMFGRKSEKLSEPEQGQLFDHVNDEGATEAAPQTDTVKTHERRKSERGKRKPIPDHLPRRDKFYDLSEDQKTNLKRIGQEISEELEYEPASIYVIRHIRYKYGPVDETMLDASGESIGVVVAPKPASAIEKGLAGPGLLAQVAVSKFADHMPLYRLERIFKRHGVNLARSSMCRWVQALATLCTPLLKLMKEQVLLSHVIQSDDTPVKQQSDEGRRGKTKTCRFWSYVGDEAHPNVIYAYTADRSRAGPENWFRGKEGEPNFGGHLQCDAYVGYDRLFESPWRMTHTGCWAHARRKFHDARLSFPGKCHHAISLIGRLYQLERRCKDLAPGSRRELRQLEARPILDEFWHWCETTRRTTLPKSNLGQAIQYALNLRQALEQYVDDGQLDIDNNACERSLRGIAIGRRNWLFTGSEAGGHAAAAMFSLIGSATLNDVEPFSYLRDIFTRMPVTPVSQIEQFLPDRWTAPGK
jgi:transposase